MNNPESVFWLFVAGLAFVAVLHQIISLTADILSRRRVKRMNNGTN